MRLAFALLLAAVPAVQAQALQAPERYEAGQIWEYRTRPEDTGSLLRIQAIEEPGVAGDLGVVYHISIVGVRFTRGDLAPEIGHLPVSRETLDASVTRLSSATPPFPDATPGIAEWRAAQGGVYTISLAEIVGLADEMLGAQIEARQ